MHKEFKFEDHAYLRVKPKRSLSKLKICAKLAPQFCGPFEILDRIGSTTYRIAFPANMRSHNVFHVSLLKQYEHDPNHKIDWNVMQVEPEGECQVELECILNRSETMLQN